MSQASRKAMWMAVGAGSAVLAGAVVERSLDAGWRAVTEKPPNKPESLKTGWKDALVWTAASAILVGVAQIAARRGAALGWRQVTGKRPPQ
jgi:hypothetical protein